MHFHFLQYHRAPTFFKFLSTGLFEDENSDISHLCPSFLTSDAPPGAGDGAAAVAVLCVEVTGHHARVLGCEGAVHGLRDRHRVHLYVREQGPGKRSILTKFFCMVMVMN